MSDLSISSDNPTILNKDTSKMNKALFNNTIIESQVKEVSVCNTAELHIDSRP